MVEGVQGRAVLVGIWRCGMEMHDTGLLPVATLNRVVSHSNAAWLLPKVNFRSVWGRGCNKNGPVGREPGWAFCTC